MQTVYADTVSQLFREKGVREECECCGHTDWVLLNNFAALAQQNSDTPGISIFPIIAVECKNCGNMRFFGRGRLGVKDETR